MKTFFAGAVITACVTASLLFTGAAPAVAGQDPNREPLGAVINDAINEGGPFFTASERALISAKCGYKPGEWDGRSISINNGVLLCGNGRKVDDPEIRAMLKVVQPRIAARVSKAMSSPAVREAIRLYAGEAARRALENLGRSKDD